MDVGPSHRPSFVVGGTASHEGRKTANSPRRARMLGRMILLVAVASIVAVSAAPSQLAAKREIKERWKACVALRDAKKSRRVFVADVASDHETRRWKRVAAAEAAGRHLASAELIYDTEGRLRFVSLSEKAPSGDHFSFTEYCFRPDSSVAFILRTFSTHHGSVKEERRVWISAKRTVVDDEVRLFDLASNRRLEPPPEPGSYYSPDAFGWTTVPEDVGAFTARDLLHSFGDAFSTK